MEEKMLAFYSSYKLLFKIWNWDLTSNRQCLRFSRVIPSYAVSIKQARGSEEMTDGGMPCA